MKKLSWRFKTKNGDLYGLPLWGRVRHYWNRFRYFKNLKTPLWEVIYNQWQFYWWKRKNL